MATGGVADPGPDEGSLLDPERTAELVAGCGALGVGPGGFGGGVTGTLAVAVGAEDGDAAGVLDCEVRGIDFDAFGSEALGRLAGTAKPRCAAVVLLGVVLLGVVLLGVVLLGVVPIGPPGSSIVMVTPPIVTVMLPASRAGGDVAVPELEAPLVGPLVLDARVAGAGEAAGAPSRLSVSSAFSALGVAVGAALRRTWRAVTVGDVGALTDD